MTYLKITLTSLLLLFSTLAMSQTITLVVAKNAQGQYEADGQVTPKQALVYLNTDRELAFQLFEKNGDDFIELSNDVQINFAEPNSGELPKSKMCKKLAKWQDGKPNMKLAKQGNKAKTLKMKKAKHKKGACYNYTLTVVGLEHIHFDPWIIIRK